MIDDRNTPGLTALAGAALRILREDCAPAFATRLHSPHVPQALLARLADWSDLLLGEDSCRAFDPEHLPDLLHAMNIALLSSCSFAAVPPRPGAVVPPGRVDLDISDLGGAGLIHRARICTCVVIVTIHGESGGAIVRAAQAELHRLMDGISAFVARAR